MVVQLAYCANSALLMGAVLVCVLPHWRAQPPRRQQQRRTSQPNGASSSSSSNNNNNTCCLLRLSHLVAQSAAMKLLLSALMTSVWLATHLFACLILADQRHLFGADLLNYSAINCALAITAITRVSFLVKTLMISVVILIQVILNKTILANLLLLRSTFLLFSVPQQQALSHQHQQHHDHGQAAAEDRANETALRQSFADDAAAAAASAPLDPLQVQLGRMPQDANMDQFVFFMTLCTVCWALFLMNRQFELTNRRLFLWRKQAEERKEKVADLRRKNEMLVYNILPPNVAKIFLGKRQLRDEELYSQSYEAVGVLFAAMPNFSDFYCEEAVNNQGLECLRFLNEVISDYDALLDQARFKNIIKIKTMGSTYMAASGLYEGEALVRAAAAGPANEDNEQRPATAGGASDACGQEQLANRIRTKWGHLEQLTEFALALKETLHNINKESFNNFVLRIGINQGPITAGVIGVKKPHFDMWGNTVNVASRMESTGLADSIQVVEETATILRHFGFQFDQRGLVSVKGKGELMTFYLTGRNKAFAAASAGGAGGGSGAGGTTAAAAAGVTSTDATAVAPVPQSPSVALAATSTSTTTATVASASTPTISAAAAAAAAANSTLGRAENRASTDSELLPPVEQSATAARQNNRHMFITPPSGQRAANYPNDAASDV